jgi:hypothetical protein
MIERGYWDAGQEVMITSGDGERRTGEVTPLPFPAIGA